MKAISIRDAEGQLGRLVAEACRGETIVLTDGENEVTLSPRTVLDLEEDSPELEAELLKAVTGPHSPYSTEEMRDACERIVRKKARMTLAVEKSSPFQADVTGQFEWYFEKASEEIAWRFFKSVDLTLHKLSRLPDLGRVRHFRNPLLHGMYSYRVEPPFDKILIFYRLTEGKLSAERLMHGARDLPRRLVEPLK